MNLLRSSSTQFLVVLFFIAFCTAPFYSKHFFLGPFVRSLSTQLFFLVVLLLLLLSMTAFSCVGLSSLWLFHALYLSHLPPSSILERLSSEQFAELGSVHLLAFSARARSLAFPIFSVSVLSNLQGRFHILSSFFVFCCFLLSLVILLISAIQRAHFSYFSQGFSHASSTVFFSFWFGYF